MDPLEGWTATQVLRWVYLLNVVLHYLIPSRKPGLSSIYVRRFALVTLKFVSILKLIDHCTVQIDHCEHISCRTANGVCNMTTYTIHSITNTDCG